MEGRDSSDAGGPETAGAVAGDGGLLGGSNGPATAECADIGEAIPGVAPGAGRDVRTGANAGAAAGCWSGVTASSE